MSFNEWIEEAKTIEDKSILIVKNGIEYNIALTNPKKPKYKKHKFSGRKKYFLTGILLINKEIASQTEINKIIEENPSEEERYLMVSQLSKNAFYNMTLTRKQYKLLTIFLEANEIELHDRFYFRRYGTQFTAHFKFYMESTIAKLKK